MRTTVHTEVTEDLLHEALRQVEDHDAEIWVWVDTDHGPLYGELKYLDADGHGEFVVHSDIESLNGEVFGVRADLVTELEVTV